MGTKQPAEAAAAGRPDSRKPIRLRTRAEAASTWHKHGLRHSVAGSYCGTAQARGWVVVTSGGFPSALVAWLGFVWREERFEMFDLLLQLDHLELTPDGQPLELLQLSQPIQLPGLLLGNLPLRLHLVGQ